MLSAPLTQLVFRLLNQLVTNSSASSAQLRQLSGTVYRLELSGIKLNLQISPDGLLRKSNANPDCQISIPLRAASHCIHHDELKTYQSLTISGDKALAKPFLSALTTLDPALLLYPANSPCLGIFAVQAEKLLLALVNYLRLVMWNGSLSVSQYLQYESNWLSDKHQLEAFYAAVDELSERTERLTKRIERLSR